MIFGHLDCTAKYTCYCKNSQHGESAIKLIKINIFNAFKEPILYIFF